jgi:cyclase
MKRKTTLGALCCVIACLSVPACRKDEPAPAPSAATPSPSVSTAVAADPTKETRSGDDPKLVWTPSNVVLVSKEVAPSVFAIYPDDAESKAATGTPVATAGGFVVGEHGVVVIESMINRRLADQVQALVRAATPKPISYVVNTSYHGDHSYGNQFFPKTALFVQHVETQRYVQAHFAEDVAFMKTYFGTNQGLDELTAQTANILLHDGSAVDLDVGAKQVSVMHLGFAQTKGDLFVWVPDGKVIFMGNPLISGGVSIPWLLDGQLDAALATLRRVLAFVPPDAVVIPGHGAPTDVHAIERAITYLEKLRKEVGDAVAQGLSEEQTVQRVTSRMSEYSAYKIYPWVHSQVNVPRTFNEMLASMKGARR